MVPSFHRGCRVFAVTMMLLAATASGADNSPLAPPALPPVPDPGSLSPTPQPSATPFKKIPGQKIELETLIVEFPAASFKSLGGLTFLASGSRVPMTPPWQAPAPAPTPKPQDIFPKAAAEIIERLKAAEDGSMTLDLPLESINEFTPAQMKAISRLLLQSNSVAYSAGPTISVTDGEEAKVDLGGKVARPADSAAKGSLRNVHALVRIKVAIGADGDTVALDVHGESTIFFGSLLKKAGKTMLAASNADGTVTAKNGAPVFARLADDGKIDINLWDGLTALIGGAVPELHKGTDEADPPVAQRGILIFITPHIVRAHVDEKEEEASPPPAVTPH